jgi:hypothetical protein
MNTNNPFNPDSEGIYRDYSSSGSFFESISENQSRIQREIDVATVPATLGGYVIPLFDVRAQVLHVEKEIDLLLEESESLLSKLYINSLIDFELNDAHRKLCREAKKQKPEINENINFICFGEVIYAERLGSYAAKLFLDKYMKVLTHSTFSYLFYFRLILKVLKNEINNIKFTLLSDYGDEYDDESQEKVALQFDSWAKTTLHFIQRISSIISSEQPRISSAEVDNLQKKHAIQSQAFFAVKLNSINNRIDNLIAHLEKDFKSNSDLFFNKYLRPSIRMQKDISSTLFLDFQTTSFVSEYPQLSVELFEAINAIKGNFYSIYSDLYERYVNSKIEIDRVFELIIESRKYSAYISQLSTKGVDKQKILSDVYEENYNTLFRSIIVDSSSYRALSASHSMLDGLDNDDHPQYLLRDGGRVIGDIHVDPGVKIDGIDISDHTHNGTDGSRRIRSVDIDYSFARGRSDSSALYADKPLSIIVDSFDTKIVDGGQPVTDVTFAIEINDFDENDYEFEIFYTEIESE